MADKKMVFFWIFLVVFLGIVALALRVSEKKQGPTLMINNETLFLELADTPEKRTQGLSGRDSLPTNKGMLFSFPKPDNYSFWMKEMKFNLDFIFINGQEVVAVAEDIPFPKVNEEPQIIKPEKKYDQVLEVNQGIVKKLNIKAGDKAVFSP